MEMLITQACKAEVESRSRQFVLSEEFAKHIKKVAEWLIGNDSTFGLFFCGKVGNGKTTLIKALQSVYALCVQHEKYSAKNGFEIVTAKDLVYFAKQWNNPSKENKQETNYYENLKNKEILGIDDLGAEPKEAMSYGDFVTAVIDIISYRYDKQLCTIISSNLTPADVSKRYDERIADRLREMMCIINFGDEKSFRNI